MAHTGSILAHQFDDLAQQKEASSLGMWAFLATELMFFGGAFTAFAVYRVSYSAAFAYASEHFLNHTLGTINTGVLLCSSLTVAMGVYFAHHGHRRLLIYMLMATIALAVIFLGIKLFEYREEYVHGLIPGATFGIAPNGHAVDFPQGIEPRHVQIFVSFYFAMTGLHALHMVIGIAVFAVITWMAWRGRFSAEYYTPVEMSGLYWHFVDLVWIYLFPTLYLLH